MIASQREDIERALKHLAMQDPIGTLAILDQVFLVLSNHPKVYQKALGPGFVAMIRDQILQLGLMIDE